MILPNRDGKLSLLLSLRRIKKEILSIEPSSIPKSVSKQNNLNSQQSFFYKKNTKKTVQLTE